VSLYAFPKQIFSGRVFEVLPDANRDRKAFLVKVSLAAPPAELRSGMSAEVNIIAGQHDGALLADTAAISEDALWVVDGGRAHKRQIKIGVRDLLRAEIVSGVKEGDLVVTAGHDGLTEGARVTATVKTPDKFESMPDATQPSQTSLR
jgi:HlyD family secretion protein